MKIAAITGGSGFIGRALTSELLKNGYDVRVLSRRALGAPRSSGSVETFAVDYADAGSVAKALDGATAVFHLAAALFAFNEREFFEANAALTSRVAQAVAKTPSVKQFVYLSSQAAAGPCGDANSPVKESDKPRPVSDYGKTKLIAEECVKSLSGVHKVVLRAPIVYGRDDFATGQLAKWAKRGIMLNASSSGTRFNFVYVDDLARALRLASQTAQADGQTFFVGEQKSYTWGEFINMMSQAMGEREPLMITAPRIVLRIIAWAYQVGAKLFGFTPALNYDKVKEACVKGHWICDTSKWTRLTGQSFTTLLEGVGDLWRRKGSSRKG
jgi:nucleoside-diphosphate-sugar epimerase